MKSCLLMIIGLLGICDAGLARGFNVLSTNPRKRPFEVVASFDLKGGPCSVDLAKSGQCGKQKRSASPVMVDLLRSRTTYPDGARFDQLSLQRQDGSKVVLWTLDECKTSPDGSGFQIVTLELLQGRDGWVEIQTVEHALPSKSDKSFQPGPPLVNRYVYERETYVRRGS